MATEDKLNDYDFTGTDAGASHTIPSEAGQIRKGGYIVIKGHPCKVSLAAPPPPQQRNAFYFH